MNKLIIVLLLVLFTGCQDKPKDEPNCFGDIVVIIDVKLHKCGDIFSLDTYELVLQDSSRLFVQRLEGLILINKPVKIEPLHKGSTRFKVTPVKQCESDD